MPYRVVKSFRFEAAHQLDRAFSDACVGCVHGHSYKVEVYLVSKCLNGDQMVLDLGMIGEMCKAIRDRWDHALILSRTLAQKYKDTPSKKIVELPVQPTAEAMAKILFDYLDDAMDDISASNGLRLEKVRVYETDTGFAEYQAAAEVD